MNKQKANEVAKKVVDQYQYKRQYSVGKVQQQVLTALGVTVKINGSSHAEQIFDALGIVVSSRREGRSFIPVVSRKVYGGGFNIYGEGEDTYTPSHDVDLSGINQWMEA